MALDPAIFSFVTIWKVKFESLEPTLPACTRPTGNCSRWSGAPRRSAWGATPWGQQNGSSWDATRHAALAPPSRTAQGRGSWRRIQAGSEAWWADPRSPFPCCLCALRVLSGSFFWSAFRGCTRCPHGVPTFPQTAEKGAEYSVYVGTEWGWGSSVSLLLTWQTLYLILSLIFPGTSWRQIYPPPSLCA